MEFAMGFALTLWACFTYWLHTELREARKAAAGLKRSIDMLEARAKAVAKPAPGCTWPEGCKWPECACSFDRMVAGCQSHKRKASSLPKIFTEEEFKAREQMREECRVLGRRREDRDAAPKPGLDWQDQDRDDMTGAGI